MGVVELVAGAFYLMILVMRYNTIPFDESVLLFFTVLYSAYFLIAGVGFRKKTFFLLALFRHDGEEKLVLVFRLLGTGTTSVDSLRIWSAANFGEDLVFGPRDGGLS